MGANPLESAMDKMSVAPGAPEDEKPAPVLSADAGTDESIAHRMYKNPLSPEAQLDRGLDESMDASDPPASTQPGTSNDLPASSGYDEKAEKKLAKGEPDTFLGKIAAKLGLD